jgi:predicted extracellular nuclease
MIHVKSLGDPGVEFYALNNHFTSLAGGIEATEPRRNDQALWNTEVMRQIRQLDPEAEFIILGDLNSFLDSLPLQTLEAAGLRHVFNTDPSAAWYSYVYQGASQTLDHILVTSGLFDELIDVFVLHANADFPPPPAGDATPLHSSDHDPIVAIFQP